MKTKPISKWELFLLKFKPTFVSVDDSDENYTCKVYFKIMFGKTYVTKVRRYQ